MSDEELPSLETTPDLSGVPGCIEQQEETLDELSGVTVVRLWRNAPDGRRQLLDEWGVGGEAKRPPLRVRPRNV